MATTIDRSGITPTNDTGTPSAPIGDGTLISASFFALIYDEIDQLFNGTTANPFVFGARLQVDGFGTHAFDASSSGGNELRVRNSHAGTASYGRLSVGNDTSASAVTLTAYSSTFSGISDYGYLQSALQNGLIINASHASGDLWFYTANTFRAMIDESGRLLVGTSSPQSDGALEVTTSKTLSANADGTGFYTRPTFVEAASGTHTNIIANYFNTPAITAGAATVTNAYTVYIAGAPTAATNNYALYVAGGASVFPDGSASVPAIRAAGQATGIYWNSGGSILQVATNGVICAQFGGASIAEKYVSLPASANGTGTVGGNYLLIGRNSSGAGAPGVLTLHNLNGSPRNLWVDSTDDLRVWSSAPTEASGDSPGGAAYVGDQTSTRETKTQIRPFVDYDGALALLRRTPLYGFRYKKADADTDHVGILADESPEFTRRQGQSFDPINAFGYTAAAVKALLARVEALEAHARG